MQRKEIVFTINQKGEITSTIKGVKGGSCARISEAFKSLGTVVGETRTDEYFETEDVNILVKGTN